MNPEMAFVRDGNPSPQQPDEGLPDRFWQHFDRPRLSTPSSTIITPVFRREISMNDWIVKIFENLRPNSDVIFAEASGYQLEEWKLLQQGLVMTSGVVAGSIPFFHLAAMAGDAAFLVNRMGVTAYGVGSILGSKNGLGNILEVEDFPAILSLWVGDTELTDAAIGKGTASLAGKVGGKAASKILAKTMCEKAGILIGKKIGGKLAVKIGTKFGAKLATKTAGGFLPFAGAAIGGGINVWFINSIFQAAESWYQTKLHFATS
jgi:hypothetical protein